MRNCYASIPTFAWVLLRRLRYAYVRAVGSGVLDGQPIGVDWKRDWQVVRAIKSVAKAPPEKRSSAPDLGEFWHTPAGEFWAPPGVSADFMWMLSVEVLSDTYGYAALRRPAPIVFDCGANIGVFSRMALDRGAQRVVCCEPSPETARCLEATFASEIGCGRLRVVKKAVWDKPGTLDFSTAGTSNPGSHQVVQEGKPDTIAVEATTVDCIVKEMSLPGVDFIKMDVEGAEVRALQGACQTIRRFHPLIGLGTEHTGDIAANNEAVIRAVRQIDPGYRLVCTEVHAERSPSRGLVLTPYSLFFY